MAAARGKRIRPIKAAGKKIHLPRFRRSLRSKEIPVARAVQSRGTNTKWRGSFRTPQVMVRITATGISQSRAKFAELPPAGTRGVRDNKNLIKIGSMTGRQTISIQALNHREKPKPPGSIRELRKKEAKAVKLPKKSAQKSHNRGASSGEREIQK